MINTELERKYLDTNDFVKNEHGRYVYANRNGEHIVDLECILEDYYSWRKDGEICILASQEKKRWWQVWKLNIKPAL
jgi:hypothetical protein